MIASIDYNEDTLQYNHVLIHVSSKLDKIFNSGDFVKDWFDAMKCVIDFHIKHKTEYISLITSSSIDHFISDTQKYQPCYLYETNGDYNLFYPDYNDELWYRDVKLNGIEFFVNKDNLFSWKELKEYCKYI